MAKGDKQDFINRDKAVSDLGVKREGQLFKQANPLSKLATSLAQQNLLSTNRLVDPMTEYLLGLFNKPAGPGYAPRTSELPTGSGFFGEK